MPFQEQLAKLMNDVVSLRESNNALQEDKEHQELIIESHKNEKKQLLEEKAQLQGERTIKC